MVSTSADTESGGSGAISGMSTYWQFARRMLRYKSTLAAAGLFAMLSAGGLTGGLIAFKPVLQMIIRPRDEAKGLQEIAREAAAAGKLPIALPQSIIDLLPTSPFASMIWILCGIGVLAVVGGTCNFLHQYFSLTVVYRTVTNIRREAFHHILRMPLKDVIAGGTQDAIGRAVNDSATLGTGFNSMLSKAMANVLRGFGALAAAFSFDWKISSVAIPLALVLGLIIRKLGKVIRRASKLNSAAQARLYGAANEALQGLRVVKAHTTERYEAGRFHRINKEAMSQLLMVRTARAAASPLVEVLALFTIGAIMLIPLRAILAGSLDASSFLMTIGALAFAGASLKPLTSILNDIQAATGSADRLRELLDWPREPGHDPALTKIPRHARTVEFRGVRFTYPGAAEPSIRGVDLVINHGETVAFVGPNGSGKTTLLALVPRLFDVDPGGGAVLVDGHDIREINIRSLRRQIGVVTQETVLFKGTIRSNIAYGAENTTDDKIHDAARRARAHDFISRLPNGYDSVVGEQGLTMSGGQRQRIAIARAILRDPAILILDEATSMIDADSEAQIAAAITDFSFGRTCLVVAHRLSTVVNAHRIVVMDRGAIVDVGRHAELLERCEVYRMIAKNQLVQGA